MGTLNNLVDKAVNKEGLLNESLIVKCFDNPIYTNIREAMLVYKGMWVLGLPPKR